MAEPAADDAPSSCGSAFPRSRPRAVEAAHQADIRALPGVFSRPC
jgi:hypothetical protein